MIRPVIVNEGIPPGTLFREWTNLLDGWLYLQIPDGAMLPLAPGGRVQVSLDELARLPKLDAWLEGLELCGVLRASAP